MTKRGWGYTLRKNLARKLYPGGMWDAHSEQAAINTYLDFSLYDIAHSQAIHRAFQDTLEIRSLTWFIPDFRHAYYGGIYTILRFASHLKTTQGIESQFALVSSQSEESIANKIYMTFPALTGSKVQQIRTYDDLEKLSSTDAGIATLWNTAYYLLRFNRTKRKFYFLQDYEALFYPAGTIYAQVEATYRFGFYGIANTPSIERFYEEQYRGSADFFFPCVDTDVFQPSELQYTQQPASYKVFFYGRPEHPRNAFELGIAGLKQLKAKLGNRVSIVSAGDDWNPVDFGLRGIVQNLGLLDYKQTAELYQTCDAALILMFTRHPSYLPLELMSSGCLVVTNYNPATTWLLKDGENCLLTAPSPTCIAETLYQALTQPELREMITINAVNQIRESYSDWTHEIDRIYQVMCAPKILPPTLDAGLVSSIPDPAAFNVNEVTFNGERACHLYPNDCYYAHLSLYYFALPFAKDCLVLDAGSGTGYGSAYLATHGAKFVWGIDISDLAIAFSRAHFHTPNLHYQTMTLENITGFPQKSLDLIFSSNVLEHVPNVLPFFRSAWELLKSGGTVILVVPPVTDDISRNANLENPYHLNIWSPEQWHHILDQYFSEIQAYRHDGNKPDVVLDFGNTPENTVINETDFMFEPISLAEYRQVHTLGIVFVARKPRGEHELPALGTPLTFVDDSFTRIPGEITTNETQIRYLLKRARSIIKEGGWRAFVSESISYINWYFGNSDKRKS